MIAVIFWIAACVLGYVYVGYPLIVRALAKVTGRPVRRGTGRPSVTVVISAYNEQKGIRDKIDNVLALEYSPNQLDVIVVSDASSDKTDELVQSYGSPRVRLLRVEGRQGKTACQNHAVTQAAGEIVVFTDATTIIEKHALLAMVENFADPEVGCVAGSLVYQGRGENLTASGGTSYWGYEIALRSAESHLGTLIGVSGCLYAVRTRAYRPIPTNLISDFCIAMRMREQGLRTILDPRAVCFEETLDRSHQELAMRIRVAVRSIGALVYERRMLNPFFDLLFSWQLWSHKLLRYASPYFWAVALISCALLLDTPLYRWLFVLQLGVIGAGLAGFLLHRYSKSMGLLSKPYYFLLTNLASLIATFRYVKGERMVTWNPIR
jgi:cellulose synthase/poly-beta-1,6-N-acetylglucosamine synthase-like glycosyltransferase